MKVRGVVIEQISGAATAIGVLAALYQLRLSRLQGRATFEQQFVHRYWTIEDDRLRDGTERDAINRQRYLRLCEDQFEHVRLGQVSKRTWAVWHSGIRPSLSSDIDGAGEFTLRCAEGEATHDPGDCPGIKR